MHSADVPRFLFTGLLCLQVAREGGLSSWASSHTVYNELLRSRPDLVKIFSQPWFIDRKNEVPAGKKPYYVMPVFNFYEVNLLRLTESLLATSEPVN